MTGNQIINLAHTLTNKNAEIFLDDDEASSIQHLNVLYGHRVLEIIRMGMDKNASIQHATTTFRNVIGLPEGEVGHNGEYPFPTDLIRPVRVEVSYDGKKWETAEVYDNMLNRGSEYNDEQLKGGKVRVDFSRESYKIRPLNTNQDVPNGIYIEYEKRQAPFVSSSEPVEIEPNLQDILAYDLAELEIIKHAEKYDPQKIALFERRKKAVEAKFLKHYRTRLHFNKKMTFIYDNYQ